MIAGDLPGVPVHPLQRALRLADVADQPRLLPGGQDRGRVADRRPAGRGAHRPGRRGRPQASSRPPSRPACCLPGPGLAPRRRRRGGRGMTSPAPVHAHPAGRGTLRDVAARLRRPPRRDPGPAGRCARHARPPGPRPGHLAAIPRAAGRHLLSHRTGPISGHRHVHLRAVPRPAAAAGLDAAAHDSVLPRLPGRRPRPDARRLGPAGDLLLPAPRSGSWPAAARTAAASPPAWPGHPRPGTAAAGTAAAARSPRPARPPAPAFPQPARRRKPSAVSSPASATPPGRQPAAARPSASSPTSPSPPSTSPLPTTPRTPAPVHPRHARCPPAHNSVHAAHRRAR